MGWNRHLCGFPGATRFWIFDVSPGRLFVVRSAGNTVLDDGVASMEYVVTNLGVSLIMVLGHSGCGAVSAALGSSP